MSALVPAAAPLAAAPLGGEGLAARAWERERVECEEAKALVEVRAQAPEEEVPVGVPEMLSRYPKSW